MAYTNPVQVQRFLIGVDYPCSKSEIMKHAAGQGAGEDVMRTLENLSQDAFSSPKELTQALGEGE